MVSAAVICVLTAATLALLMRSTDKATAKQRAYGSFWVAIIAGVGVWTTHFVAMLGYRPDAVLYYDAGLTIVSIIVGITCIGVPLALSEFYQGSKERRALGCAAGVGVSAMHLTGISAVQNCLPTFSPTLLGLAVTISMASFAWALSQSRRTTGGLAKSSIGIVGGVCGLHFTAMASTTLTEIENQIDGLGKEELSNLVFVTALLVFAIGFICTTNHRRRLSIQQMKHADSFPAAQRIVRSLRP